ncbi:MAG: hypothetical protein LBT81_01450 [Helicobacteraceae bacterium]|jgi:hypothetical protein|nr:hypothetical protein [Helicobacteraceae bacterium]
MGLKEWRDKKRAETIAEVLRALERLKESGRAVNFRSLSEEANVSRKTLYQIEEIRAYVRRERGENDGETKLLQRIKELESENRSLKAALKEIKVHALSALSG